MAFHNVRLPDDIEVGATGGPSFLTNVVSLASGAEQRNESWQQSRVRWQISWGCQERDTVANDHDGYDRIMNFFQARRGRLHTFLFRDWSDYTATDEFVATGDGVQRLFHLIKTYGDDASDQIRYIIDPDWDTVVVKVGGVADNSWDPGEKGTIVWPDGSAPTGEITWTGEFNTRVRFDSDDFNVTLGAAAVGEIDSLSIIEVRVDPNVAPIGVGFANSVTSINENASTAARVKVADLVAIDDGLGDYSFSVGGADAAFFEIEDDDLYLKAGTTLNYDAKTSYSITVSVQDVFLSDAPASSPFTLTVVDVNEAPQVSLSAVLTVVDIGYDTTLATKVADIVVTDDALGSYVLSLSGTDAASFEITGGDLYLKAGVSTASADHLDVTVTATDASIPASTSADFDFTIGLVAAANEYTTPGGHTFVVPVYNTLVIEVWSPGGGTWGWSTAGAVAPTPATLSRVQNDQTVTSLERWRVQPFLPDDATDPYTPASKEATAKMDSFGIGPTLETYSRGALGALGYGPATTPHPGRGIASGKGGDGVAGEAGGVAKNFVAADPSSTATTVEVEHGADGASPGAGAGGGLFKETSPTSVTRPGYFGEGLQSTTTDLGMAGASAGFYAKYTFVWGSAQSGADADYFASAPAMGDTLTITVGTAGQGGAGTVNGGDGGGGKVRITVA